MKWDWHNYGKTLQRWLAPSVLWTLGGILTVKAAIVDKVLGWQSYDGVREGVKSVDQTILDSEGYRILDVFQSYFYSDSTGALLIPIALIVGIVFLVLAYKLTPKSTSKCKC